MSELSNCGAQRHGGGRPRKGSLEFRGGTWHARLTVTIEGEAIRKWFDLETDNRAVARRKMARLLAKHVAPNLEAAAVEVARPESYSELAVRVALKRREEGIADCRTKKFREGLWVLPEIGTLAVNQVRPEHIAGIYENARAKGRSLSLLRNLRTVMQSRFNVALEEEVIAESPTKRVRIPKVKIDRRERAVLTDAELITYLAWQHPSEGRQMAVLERQVMSALARMFGGLRTGDIHGLRWEHFDTNEGAFTWGMALRRKTARPQRIEVPGALRPILADWWARKGKAAVGPVFPLLRGKSAGEGRTHKASHAKALRRDLQAAFAAHREANKSLPTEVLDTFAPGPRSARWLELFEQTEFTRPVDFHSWRRKFVQALADIGLSAQQAQKLAGHADLAAHERYLRNTTRTLVIPSGALPNFTTRVLPRCRPKLKNPDSQSAFISSALEKIRTSDIRFRRPTLYPAELRARRGQ